LREGVYQPGRLETSRRRATRDRVPLIRARTCAGPEAQEAVMSHHVYRLSEIVGSSPSSVDEAIRTAIRKASQTVRNIEWFETREIRGQVVDGDVAHYQVRLKIGFRVED
jgi:dodecin